MERECKNPRCLKPFTPDNPARLYCCEDCKCLSKYAPKQSASTAPDKVKAARDARRLRFEEVMRKHGLKVG